MSQKEQLQQHIREVLRSNDCRLIGLPEMKISELKMVSQYLVKHVFVYQEFVGIAKMFSLTVTLL